MTPVEIVNQMLRKDSFSQWLGIEILEIRKGYCRCSLKVKEDMLNGFSIAHGGIAISLADSAAAFAANAKGFQALTLHSSTQFIQIALPGATLMAIAEETIQQGRNMHYTVQVFNIDQLIIVQQVILNQTKTQWTES